MRTQPYVVWHTELRQEDDYPYLSRRYIAWADSPVEAARFVDQLKQDQGRLLPDRYTVCAILTGQHGSVVELSHDDSGSDKHDLNCFEELFGEGSAVQLDRKVDPRQVDIASKTEDMRSFREWHANKDKPQPGDDQRYEHKSGGTCLCPFENLGPCPAGITVGEVRRGKRNPQ